MDNKKVKMIELDSGLTLHEKRINLQHVYDVINKIAKNLSQKGVDVSQYFYTKEEVQKLKQIHPEYFI